MADGRARRAVVAPAGEHRLDCDVRRKAHGAAARSECRRKRRRGKLKGRLPARRAKAVAPLATLRAGRAGRKRDRRPALLDSSKTISLGRGMVPFARQSGPPQTLLLTRAIAARIGGGCHQPRREQISSSQHLCGGGAQCEWHEQSRECLRAALSRVGGG